LDDNCIDQFGDQKETQVGNVEYRAISVNKAEEKEEKQRSKPRTKQPETICENL
jgi:hypothetical protein